MPGPKAPSSEGVACDAIDVLRGRSEHAITVNGMEGSKAAQLLKRDLDRRKAIPLSLFVFGGNGANEDVAALFAGSGAGISRLRGDGVEDGGPVALQMFAASGVKVKKVVRRGNSVGIAYEDGFTRSCRLSSVVPVRLNASREAQAREVLETAEEMLLEMGFRFNDTVRTWFYLERLLEWYDGFNTVRNDFFGTRGVFDAMVPASTGIGAGNACGAALSCDLLAIRPKSEAVSIRSVPSPLQDSALKYRSAFSRAVEIATPDCRRLLISGTASIDREGRSVYGGNPAAQIELTVQVIDALLKSRNMGWPDVTRGIAYFKRMSDRGVLDRCLGKRGVASLPLAVVEADICRPELEFEVEIDAAQKR